jgi:PAS domain S-box-containing protein
MDPIDELPLAYIEMDVHGIITRANRAARTLHPLDRGELVGKLAWDFMAADEKDPSFAAYCTTIVTGEAPAVVRRSLYDRSGEFRTYELHRRLVRDGDGIPAGMRMLFVDVTEAKKALEEAQRTRLQLQSVMESMGGWKAAELTGRLIEEGVPILAYLSGERSELDFKLSLEGRTKGLATILDRNRREMHVEIGTSPVSEKETGSTTGVVLVLRRLELRD